MVDEPTSQEDDYDLLTHHEAGKRLAENIEHERQRCGGSDGDRSRLTALEEAARRHREYRPADRPTFFNEAGVIERVDTSKPG